ncbi:transposase [Winogradskyella undariae]|uniref:transposase n=1 Tax=Winogradskyella undariae TaxID=1285465 RepID=UPI0015C7535F|nr:transposase [Winogradskyella undariae]
MKDRKRNRMKGYDYSRDNLYFVTICVDGMVCCLGDVVDIDGVGTSRDLSVHRDLSANSDFKNIPQKRMQLNKYGKIVETQLNWLQERYDYVVVHAKIVMPNHVHAVLEIDRSLVSDKAVKIKSLSGLVGAFKTTSSKLIHRADFMEYKWKRSFHDHIIKNDKSYQNIVNYIHHNPEKWEDDTFNKK